MVVALRCKILAGVSFAFAALFMWAEIHMPHAFDPIGATIFAVMVLVAVPAAVGLWFFSKAKRVTNAGHVASTDPSFTWHLVGRHIAATDGSGAPRPDLSFAITGAIRRTVTAIPRATAQR
jgi:hypothetical protein